MTPIRSANPLMAREDRRRRVRFETLVPGMHAGTTKRNVIVLILYLLVLALGLGLARPLF